MTERRIFIEPPRTAADSRLLSIDEFDCLIAQLSEEGDLSQMAKLSLLHEWAFRCPEVEVITYDLIGKAIGRSRQLAHQIELVGLYKVRSGLDPKKYGHIPIPVVGKARPILHGLPAWARSAAGTERHREKMRDKYRDDPVRRERARLMDKLRTERLRAVETPEERRARLDASNAYNRAWRKKRKDVAV